MDRDFASRVLFRLWQWEVTMGDLFVVGLGLILLTILYYRYGKRIGQYLFKTHQITQAELRQLHRSWIVLVLSLVGWILVTLFEWNVQLIDEAWLKVDVLQVLTVLMIWAATRLLVWTSEHFFREFYMRKQRSGVLSEYDKRNKDVVIAVGKGVLYLFALTWSLKVLELNPAWSFSFGQKDGEAVVYTIRLTRILGAIQIFFVVRLLVWALINFVLQPLFRRNHVSDSQSYAVNRLLKYFIYLIAISLVFEYLGLQLTLLWGSIAALLVGVGLGLQDFIRDFVAGLMLLLERSIGVGDVVEVDGVIGKVKQIGTRVTMIETNYLSTLIVPNSRLISGKVINWSKEEDISWISVHVVVPYGCDLELVRSLLKESALEQEDVLPYPEPEVLLTEFGNDGLELRLIFLTNVPMKRLFIASSIRYAIDRRFREHGIEIPYPQRDVHLYTHDGKGAQGS